MGMQIQPSFCSGPTPGRARGRWGSSLRLLWAVVAVLLPAFAHGGMAAQEAADPADDRHANTAAVQVTGVADNGRGNLGEALKRDACRKAIEQVAGFKIVSRTVALDSFVKTFLDLQIDGFVVECRPLSGVRSQGGTSTQEFAVTVKTGLLDKELLAKKIDEKLLYDMVDRPLICVAIEDKIKDAPGKEWDTTTQLSFGRIAGYFLRLNRNFEFRDLNVMRRSTNETIEAVALEQAADYDLLVSGRTRIEAGAEYNDIKPDYVNPFDPPGRGASVLKFHTRVEWRVTEVASKRLVLSIDDESSERVLGDGLSKTNFLDKKVTELFRELAADWISKAFRAPYKIVFSSSGRADSDALLAGLKLAKGLDSESITMSGETKGRITFSATASGDLAEIRGSLEKSFKDKYRIVQARRGQIFLELESDPGIGVVNLEISNLSASRARDIKGQIERMGDVSGLKQINFAGNRLVLELRSALSAEDLALALEKGVSGLRISDYSPPNATPARITASWQ